jgi:hypothetical protein
MLRIAIKMLFHSRAHSLSTLIGVAIAFVAHTAGLKKLIGLVAHPRRAGNSSPRSVRHSAVVAAK